MLEPTTIYGGDVTVKMTANHVYYVTYGEYTNKSKWKISQGVTGVLDSLYDQRTLIDWASGMAAKNIVLALGGDKHKDWLDKAMLAIYKGELPAVPAHASNIIIEPMTGQDLIFMYQNGIEAYQKKAEYGKSVGTQVHDAIDRWHTTGSTEMDPSGDIEQDKVAYESFKNYQAWFKKAGLEVVDSERPLHSKVHNYCGTLDRVYREIKTGRLILGDFKTSNISRKCPTGVREQYWSQVGAYTVAYEEETGNKIEDLLITNSPKNGRVQVVRASTIGFAPEFAKQCWLDDLKAARNHKDLSKMMRGVKSEV